MQEAEEKFQNNKEKQPIINPLRDLQDGFASRKQEQGAMKKEYWEIKKEFSERRDKIK